MVGSPILIWRFGILGALISVMAIGCGDSSDPGSTPQPAATERVLPKEETSEAKAETPQARPEPKSMPEPASSKSNDLQDGVRTESRELCGLFDQQQIAAEYGANPNDISAVIKAFASGYQPEVQVSAESGCLEGLTK